MRVYIDGTLDGSVQDTAAMVSYNSETVFIGQRQVAWPFEFYEGQIDEVKIFNYALTAAAIQTDHNVANGCSARNSQLTLPAGTTYYVTVRATNGAGQQTMATSDGVTIDASPPDTTITSNPPAVTNSTSATFQFAASDGSGGAGPIAYWRLDEASGTSAADSSGNGYDGTVNGGAAWTSGKVNGTLELDGVDDYVSASGSILNSLPQGTVQAWVYLDQLPSLAATIVAKGAPVLTDFIFSIGTDGALAAHMGTGLYLVSSPAVTPQTWALATLTWDGTAWRIFLNGQLIAETSTTTAPHDEPTNVLKIGRHDHTSGPYFFDGRIDEVKIYNYARTPDQIISDHSAGLCTFQRNLDGAGWVGTTSPEGLSGLGGGSHTYQVRAIDAAGNVDPTPASWTWTVDSTAPVAGMVSDSTGADIDVQSSTTTISANWSGFSDPESGIAGYEWAIGTTAGGTDIQAYASVGAATSGTNSSLTLVDGGMYYVTIRATNGAALTSTAASDGVTVDTTAPDTTITSNPSAVTNSTSATFQFAASDAAGGAGPIAYWRLDETSGTSAADSSGNGYTGTVNGGAAWTSGKVNGTLELDGVDDYVSAPGSIVNSLPQGTVQAWVYLDQLPALVAATIVAKGAPVLTDFIFGINPDGALSAHMGTGLYLVSPPAVTPQTWTLATLTWDGTAWRIFLNGQLIAETSTTTAPHDEPTNELKIGRHDHTSGPYFFDGRIDEVKIYNYARTSAQIMADHSAGLCTFQRNLDGAGWVGTTSPESLTGLGAGVHTYQVRAIDAAGNVDLTPASWTWTVVTSPPTVTGITPNQGATAGSVQVTITGTGFVGSFADGSLTVTVGGAILVNPVLVSATQITGLAPAGSAGGQDVVVTNVAGPGTLSGGFSYLAPPTVASINPVIGPIAGGTAVTIIGTNFAAGAEVTIGSNALTGVIVVNSTTITGTTPAGVSGHAAVAVTTPGGSATLSGSDFRYVGPPQIAGIDPGSGSTIGGTNVTIQGIDLDGTDAAATSTVTVGGNGLTGLNVAVGGQSLTGTTPAGTAGVAALVVTTDQGTVTLPTGFTYVPVAPTISTVSPATGPTAGGTTITITGTGFTPSSTGTIGGTAIQGLTFIDSTQLSGGSPVGVVGAQDVVVTNAGGSATLVGGFTYSAPAPTLTSIEPNTGPAGTLVVITGSGFLPGTTVTVGGAALIGLVVQSSALITGTVPAAGAGAQDVVVTNANGTATLTGGFTYTAPPTATVTASPTTGEAPLAVTFSVTTTNLGTIANVAWDFNGDGVADLQGASLTTAIHTYGFPGAFNALATVTDIAGNQATSAAVLITVTDPPAPPTTVSADATNGTAPLAVNFTVNSPPAAAVAYQWDFDGDADYETQTTGSPPAPTVARTYIEAGTFDGTLRIVLSDGTTQLVDLPDITVAPFGGIGTTSVAITRLFKDLNQNSEFDVAADDNVDFAGGGIGAQTVAAGQVLGFQATTTPDPGLPGGATVGRWEWDVDGDGAFDLLSSLEPSGGVPLTIDETEFSRQYGQGGSYVVMVRCVYSMGGSDLFSVQDTVTLTVAPSSLAISILHPVTPWPTTGLPTRVAGNAVGFEVGLIPTGWFDTSTATLQVWRVDGWEMIPAGFLTLQSSHGNHTWLRLDVNGMISSGFLAAEQQYPFRARATLKPQHGGTTAVSDQRIFCVTLSTAFPPPDINENANSPVTLAGAVPSDSGIDMIVGGEVEAHLALGCLAADTTLTVKDLASNPTAVAGPETGVSYGEATLGAGGLSAPAVVRLYYADADEDGTVDGTSVPETSLKIYRFNTVTAAWMTLADQTVNPSENWVEGATYSFSDFGLGGASAGEGGSSGSSGGASGVSDASTGSSSSTGESDVGSSSSGGCWVATAGVAFGPGVAFAAGILLALLAIVRFGRRNT